MKSTRPTAENVAAKALALGRELTSGQAQGLAAYLELLETWNRRTNLAGPKTWPEMLSRLVADSWHLADLFHELALPPDSVTLDFGAGAGLPGVPLRLFWKAGRYVLIEPRARRAAFLRQCLAMMRIKEAEVFEGRYEALASEADICVSRAFQPWPAFLATAGKFKREGTCAAPLVVVFANAKTPDQPLPEGWELRAVREYPRFEESGTLAKPGYFWVFVPASAPS